MFNSNPNEHRITRRRLLRGAGAAVTLPLLGISSQATRKALAAGTRKAGLTASGAPLRVAFMSIPNGVQQKHWFPDQDFNLNTTMQPLEELKQHFQVIAGLDHENATAGPDGAGDHARANATFLTGKRARKTAGRDIQIGTSVDQVMAQAVKGLTRFPSVELSCDSVRTSGRCDSGYACAYQYNLSWSSSSTPVTPEPNPRLAFERLFGAGQASERKANLAQRQASERSILDFVLEDARDLKRELGSTDHRKLDQYLDSVRAIEKRIAAAENLGDAKIPGVATPAGIPASYSEHMNLMFDLLATVFESDAARVGTILLAHDGSNRTFPEIGIREGHHHLSHNQEEAALAAKIAEIDKYYITHLARFLNRLNETQDVDGNSILHNSMIVYGGAIADGNRHTHDNLPVILAGHAGGAIQSNRHLQLQSQPMSNLFVAMLEEFGAPSGEFGDSNGRVDLS